MHVDDLFAYWTGFDKLRNHGTHLIIKNGREDAPFYVYKDGGQMIREIGRMIPGSEAGCERFRRQDKVKFEVPNFMQGAKPLADDIENKVDGSNRHSV